jgi:hypothetical protein
MIPEPALAQSHPGLPVVMTSLIVIAAGLSSSQPVMSQGMTSGLYLSENGSDLLMMASEIHGVRVQRLRQHRFESPLREGDLITRADGIAIAVPEDLFGYLRTHPTPASVVLVVTRGNQEVSMTIGTDLLMYVMPPAPPSLPEIPS